MRYILSIFIILPFILSAQAPKVIGKTPVSHTITAQANENINIVFNQSIDPNSITEQSFKVFGRWSGPMRGTVTLQNEDREILFTPADSFFAGEWVTVYLSRDIKNSNGAPLETGYTWNYWIATSSGILDQPLVKTIPLRGANEFLIQAYGAYAGDLNDDGYSDLTVINETSDDLRIFLNDGNGDYQDYELISMGNSTPSPNEGADFNNDGYTDLAVSTAHGSEVRVLMGDGTGTFPSMEKYEAGYGVRGLVVLDCNGDGHEDIFVTNRLSDDMAVMTNDGTGKFTTTMMNSPLNAETSCAVSDVNNDGIMDIFFAAYESKEVGILLGDGNGGFEMSVKKSVIGQPWMIAAGDLNGDGHADVASANSTSNSSVILFGTGTGGLSNPITLAADNGFFPLAIDLGDLDGDGDLDIVTSNYSSGNYSVFENDGVGNFTLAATLEAPNKASCAILHDRDNDGDLDISSTDEGDDVILLFENQILDAVDNIESNPFNIKVSPNPFSESTAISFDLPEAGNGNWEIVDARGKIIQSSGYQKFKKGKQKFEFTKNSLRSGVYFFHLKVGSDVISQKLIIQ